MYVVSSNICPARLLSSRTVEVAIIYKSFSSSLFLLILLLWLISPGFFNLNGSECLSWNGVDLTTFVWTMLEDYMAFVPGSSTSSTSASEGDSRIELSS